MWNQPRKSYRSPEKTTSQAQRLSTTCLVTPGKDRGRPRQCPLHFNEPSHICLTCRKSICLRCALTYCQSHAIRSEHDALPGLREQLLRLQLAPRSSQLQAKLQQSRERQQYLQKKVLRLIESVEEHFDYLGELLAKKKLQIISYFDAEFQKYLQEHRDYDSELRRRAQWLAQHAQLDPNRLPTIEDVDHLAAQLKKAAAEDAKAEKKVTRLLMGKDKLRIDRLWSEEHLEKVLLEIERIPYRMEPKTEKRRKRVTTENAHEQTVGFAKSNSNSRFPSGRKPQTPT